jgi:hypothetical protein
MAAVSTMILRSMRMIGEKTRGATLDANEQVECLDELNTFVESLNNEKLMCYSVTQDSHLLTVSTASYTIGPGATINTARPTKLVDPCWIRDSNSNDFPLKIISLTQYGLLVDKSSGASVPTHIYYEAGYSATSTATITVYPPPSVGLTMYIHSWKQMQNFSTLSQTVLFPPGYKLMFESNFAIHLAAGFRPVSAEVAKIAKESKAAIKALNVPDMVMSLDSGSRIGVSIDHGIYIDGSYIE